MEFFEQQQQHPGETNSQRQTGKVKEGRAGGEGGTWWCHDSDLFLWGIIFSRISSLWTVCARPLFWSVITAWENMYEYCWKNMKKIEALTAFKNFVIQESGVSWSQFTALSEPLLVPLRGHALHYSAEMKSVAGNKLHADEFCTDMDRASCESRRVDLNHDWSWWRRSDVGGNNGHMGRWDSSASWLVGTIKQITLCHNWRLTQTEMSVPPLYRCHEGGN